MPEAVPPFGQSAAKKALNAILDKVAETRDGSITISEIMKDVAVLTKDGKSRKALESDVDKIAVLANIIKSAKASERWPNMRGDRLRRAAILLGKARESEAFKGLTRSERKTINEAYRALNYQGVFSWASRFSDFIQQVWVDFKALIHSTEVPPADRAKIEEVLRTTIGEQTRSAEKDTPTLPALLGALSRTEQLKSNAEQNFEIREPSYEIRDFAKKVADEATKIATVLRQDLGRIRREERPFSEKIGEFKTWFRKSITAEQDDALRAMAKNPEYKEFCDKAGREITFAFKGFQDLIVDPPKEYSDAVTKHAAITTRLNALVGLEDTVDSFTNTKIPSLRRWLKNREVTDENDPRHLFLDQLNELFRSLVEDSTKWLRKNYQLEPFTPRQNVEDDEPPTNIQEGNPFDVIQQ